LKATVYVVDDDPAIRKAIQMLLESVSQPVELFASASEFLDVWDGRANAVLVLDVRLPEMSGLALQRALIEMSSILPVVFITGYADVSTAVQAMRSGAFDFLEKPFKSQDLLDTVQRALEAASDASEIQREREVAKERINRLTKRQREILERMVEGKANKVIADDLGLSQRTVEVHRAALMKKMGVDSLASAVRAFLRAADESPLMGRLASESEPGTARRSFTGDR